MITPMIHWRKAVPANPIMFTAVTARPVICVGNSVPIWTTVSIWNAPVKPKRKYAPPRSQGTSLNTESINTTCVGHEEPARSP